MPGAWRGRQGRLQSLQDPQRRGCEARHARGQNHGKRGRRRRRPAVGDRHHGGVDPEWHRDADHDGGRGRELAGHAPALSHLQGHCGRPRGGECEDPDGGGNLARRPEDQRGGLHAPGCEAREHPRLRPRPAPQELPCEDRRLHHRPRDRLARDARGWLSAPRRTEPLDRAAHRLDVVEGRIVKARHPGGSRRRVRHRGGVRHRGPGADERATVRGIQGLAPRYAPRVVPGHPDDGRAADGVG
mmetsp:Transcript_23967/g.69310  ORF Transcript_23967/g.69310 Transcript_23967/m.69310 type:complete len:243 (-) Transcript_23967:588-1316(-)